MMSCVCLYRASSSYYLTSIQNTVQRSQTSPRVEDLLDRYDLLAVYPKPGSGKVNIKQVMYITIENLRDNTEYVEIPARPRLPHGVGMRHALCCMSYFQKSS